MDATLDRTREVFQCECDRLYEVWLATNASEAKKWKSRLMSSLEGECEGAIGEAVAWCYLTDHGVQARLLVPSRAHPIPDFQCVVGNETFYVDAATICGSKCVQKSGIVVSSDDADGYASEVQYMRPEIGRIAKSKSRQFTGTKAPSAIMVVMLNMHGAMWLTADEIEEALTGPIDWKPQLDIRTGRHCGDRYVARPDWTTFFDPEGKSEGHWLSALFVGSFGERTPRVYGMANPHATHPWDHTLIPAPTYTLRRVPGSPRMARATWLNKSPQDDPWF